MTKTILSWALRLVAAVILLQTLFFKFSGAPESVAIFTELGMEPGGRILIGVIELITAVLLLIPQSAAYGGLLGAGVMTGAILGHITKLGFAGEMFPLGMLAILVFLCCVVVMFLHREQIPIIKRMLDTKER
jgi:uncharacterized membrane protein YphA (DoxX/SURF4 family)